MEIYNDRLCLTGEEVWAVLGSNFKTLLSRGRIQNVLGCRKRVSVRMGGTDRMCALYDVDEFPNNRINRYRDELYSAYPELTDWKRIQEAKEYRGALIENLVPDPKAKDFFTTYTKPNGEPLKPEEVRPYENSAMTLNAIRRVWERSYSRHATSGKVSKMRVGDFFVSMSKAMPDVLIHFKGELSFKRFNWRRLKELYDAYGNNNYSCLISGSLGNQNRTKKQRDFIIKIVLSIYGSKEKPFVSDVTKYYNEFVLGQREIYCYDTGEVFNRHDFYHRGEPITISESMVWNIINDPLNRKIVDRLRNDFHYNQNRHNADVQRKSPTMSLSKISFDDYDLVRKAKINGENVTVHAYHAFDVASGAYIGSAYSTKKDSNLIEDCMRDMWANLRRWGLRNPYEYEVENHLIKGTELEEKFRDTCMELTFCAPMNSRQKRAEHFLKFGKYYGDNSAIKLGMSHGRHYARHEAYLHSREKVFDELNDTYKNSLEAWDFYRVVMEDRARIEAYNNDLHTAKTDKKTKTKLYPGMTRMEVLMFKQNTAKCAPLNWRNLCKEWGVQRGNERKTRSERNGGLPRVVAERSGSD